MSRVYKGLGIGLLVGLGGWGLQGLVFEVKGFLWSSVNPKQLCLPWLKVWRSLEF